MWSLATHAAGASDLCVLILLPKGNRLGTQKLEVTAVDSVSVYSLAIHETKQKPLMGFCFVRADSVACGCHARI